MSHTFASLCIAEGAILCRCIKNLCSLFVFSKKGCMTELWILFTTLQFIQSSGSPHLEWLLVAGGAQQPHKSMTFLKQSARSEVVSAFCVGNSFFTVVFSISVSHYSYFSYPAPPPTHTHPLIYLLGSSCFHS